MNTDKEKQSYFNRKQKKEEQERIMQETQKAREEKIQKINSEWYKDEREFKKMTPSQKASKMIRTWCWLAYKRNGNKMSFEEWNSSELAAKVFDKVKKYFIDNKTSYCSPSVYLDIIPSGKLSS